jgi:hypothetical protein
LLRWWLLCWLLLLLLCLLWLRRQLEKRVDLQACHLGRNNGAALAGLHSSDGSSAAGGGWWWVWQQGVAMAVV